jgi:hypothetical protein
MILWRAHFRAVVSKMQYFDRCLSISRPRKQRHSDQVR